MQFFVDTAEVADIKKLHEMGLLDGVTTNPSLIAKSGRQFKEVIKEICALVPGPVSAEVAATNYDGMIAEGRVLAKLADNVVVKVPLTIRKPDSCYVDLTFSYDDYEQPGSAKLDLFAKYRKRH